jgi:putative endonuclease
MYYIYIIKSISYGNRYIGSSKDIVERLKEHNQGKCRYTKGRKPWKLIYQESFVNRSQAMQREKILKSGKGREFLDKILKNS